MKSINNEIALLVKQAIAVTDTKAAEEANVFVQFTKDLKFGDLQTNVAMTLAKALRQNPRQIAEAIKENLPENDVIAKIDIAGPGFLNFYLKDEYLQALIEVCAANQYPYDDLDTHGHVVIDYSAPNIAKRMHIGHLRSTIIGDGIKRIHRYLGYEVVADNHIGDWGTHFGKLMVGYRRWLDQGSYDQNAVEELERLYVKFCKAAEEDPAMEDLARQELKKLQDKEEQNYALWQEFIEASIAEYNKVYDRLDISFDTWHGESFYNDSMPAIVDELMDRKIAKESQGALIIEFDEDEHLHPCLIRKSDGAFLYTTSDLACMNYRKQTYDLNKVIYVTDNRQNDHFRQVFKVADLLDWKVPAEHVSFGMMKFTDGHFGTRKGNVIYLQDLLDKAESIAYDIVNEKNADLSEEEKRNVARVVGIGAVKYADLSQNRSSDIIFEWDRMLSFEGNTAPYLQYTYARIQSVLRKSGVQDIASIADLKLTAPEERALVIKLVQASSAILKAAEAYKPNLIADYAYELTQVFNSFYNATRILVEDESVKRTRLHICYKVAETVKQCLGLLGIEVVEKM